AQIGHKWQLLRALAKPEGLPWLPDTQKWVPANQQTDLHSLLKGTLSQSDSENSMAGWRAGET
ncbi:MAG: hypothetical protein ACUVX1_16370, partial [Chloroflexota bacterium]